MSRVRYSESTTVLLSTYLLNVSTDAGTQLLKKSDNCNELAIRSYSRHCSVNDLNVGTNASSTWVYKAEMDAGTTYPANAEYVVWYECDVPGMVGP